MMFVGGNILPQEELPALLDTLEERLNETRSGPPLDVDVVLDAVDSLGRALDSGELDPLLAQYAPPGALEELREVRGMLRREVLEEVGLRVRNIRYYASQPWGIDGNLSLGFFAELDGSDAITLERDELSQALWVRREDMPRHCTQNALTWDMMEAFRTGRM